MDEFWQRAAQISASGEPAVLVTVMAVHRQVPKVSPHGWLHASRPYRPQALRRVICPGSGRLSA
jgi:hypothetical protein